MDAKVLESLSKPELVAIILEQHAQIRELRERLGRLEAQNGELRARVAQLEDELAKARKDSSNSSKPPSSDIVTPPKPPKASGGGARKIGGQPGHPRHERRAFSPEEIDRTHTYALDVCPDCGGILERTDQPPHEVQQVELAAQPIRVEAHCAPRYWCPRCARFQRAALPPEVEQGGLVGPRLTAQIATMKGVCHASVTAIRTYLRDVLGFRVSRGQISKVLGKVAAALAAPYEELLAHLPFQARLNVDETGHKEQGRLLWTWCFRAEDFALFRTAETRGAQVLLDLLGEDFGGVIGCDYFSAYRKYMGDCDVLVQFCLAHLIREVRYLAELAPGTAVRAYGQGVLEALRALFATIHRYTEGAYTEKTRRHWLEVARIKVVRAALTDVPFNKDAMNLAERFRKYGHAYFTFLTTPGVEPTNNLAEQALRFVVIDRRITQGTRSPTGRQWCERIWTVIATCALQGRSAFQFIRDAVSAHFANQPVPSLLPNSP